MSRMKQPRFADDFIPTGQREWDQVKAALLESAEWKCDYCEKNLTWREATIDHAIPRAKGGTHHFVNLAIACQRCNSRKGARSPLEWMDPDEYAEMEGK